MKVERLFYQTPGPVTLSPHQTNALQFTRLPPYALSRSKAHQTESTSFSAPYLLAQRAGSALHHSEETQPQPAASRASRDLLKLETGAKKHEGNRVVSLYLLLTLSGASLVLDGPADREYDNSSLDRRLDGLSSERQLLPECPQARFGSQTRNLLSPWRQRRLQARELCFFVCHQQGQSVLPQVPLECQVRTPRPWLDSSQT